MTGASKERELVNLLDERGFAVMRAPSSGSATERELPDILAGDGEAFLAIEAKYRSSETYYFDKEEVQDLCYFAWSFGATALLAFRWNGNQFDTDWRFATPDWPERTETKVKVEFERADEELPTLDRLKGALRYGF